MDLFLEGRRLLRVPSPRPFGSAERSVLVTAFTRSSVALRGKNGGGEQLEGIAEAELDARGGIGPGQPGQYLCRARLPRLR